ncbi:hypothetical protein C2G38_1603151 [Gigaspora rosea]|uniref:DUF7431 domain-containing protein n=1 Tax=Gigaspora rosea TaxID=44941 RepID=A0A397W419_9GLOM|nr:hypothetical protein C2G38_1603151 [Gigaspora rosea]
MNNEDDLVKQLRELSGKYGHFYAHRLILGGAIHKSHVKNVSIPDSVIGGDKDKYSQDLKKDVLNALGHRILKAGIENIHFDMKDPYIHSLSPKIKEIGNVHNYQVFASIMSKNDKNFFSVHIDYVNRDKNTPVIVVHNIRGENSMPTICQFKLGWIIVGPLTNFNFNVQFPLAFRSMKQMAPIKKDHCTIKINHYKSKKLLS